VKYGSLSKEYTLNSLDRYQIDISNVDILSKPKIVEEIRRFLVIKIGINTSQCTLTKIKIVH
jgi:hypothetical protein